MAVVEALIEGLFVYPFKSARGHAKSSVVIGTTGFEWDRNWMAVDKTGRFISQRTHPRLAQLVPEVTSDSLVLRAPGLKALSVVLKPNAGRQVTVRVWDDLCTAVDQGDGPANWLSHFLEDDVRVMRVIPQPDRRANPKYAGPEPRPVTFVDGFPILVCNRASLEDLNRRMPEPIPMERFRPNIVLADLPAFAEDRISSVSVGDIELRLIKPCTRCIIPSTDQTTGQRTTDPLPVLRTFRFDRSLLGVTFGENAIVTAGTNSTLRLGSKAEITFEG